MSLEKRKKKASEAIVKILQKYELEMAVDFQYVGDKAQYKIYLKDGKNNNN